MVQRIVVETLDEKKVPENEQNTHKKRKINPYGSTGTNAKDFEEDIPKKHEKPNQTRKQNVATVCNDDNDEEKEDDVSNDFDKNHHLCGSDKSNNEE